MKLVSIMIFILLAFTGTASASFRAHGLIEPWRVVNVGSPQAGILATVAVERGDTVRKGQILATLQSRVERANLELKKANRDFAGRKKNRLAPLFKEELIAPQEMDEAETFRAVAEAEHKHAAEVLKRMTITSPISGVVVERFLSPGEYVETEPILKLANIDSLNVEVIMPVGQYSSVRVGTKATIIPENPVGGNYTAVVTVVDKVIDAASGTFGVRLKLPNPHHKLPAGISCKVIFP